MLAVAAVALGWMQARWLGQWTAEERERQESAIATASEHFDERLSQTLKSGGWSADALATAPASTLAATLASAPGRYIRWQPGVAGGYQAEAGAWRSIGAVQLQQIAGRELLSFPGQTGAESGQGFWLFPSARVACRDECVAELIPADRLRAVIGDAARQAFSNLEYPLQIAVLVADEAGRNRGILYPLSDELQGLEVIDYSRSLLSDVNVIGPAGYNWELRVNHAGGSLADSLRRSKLRGVSLSLLALTLIGLAVWLIYANARRQRGLAQQQLYFAASASHELRTPLAVIGSAADNLADGTVSEPQRVRQYGDLVRGEVRKLTTMIENVLQFSRTSARALQVETIAVRELVDTAVRDCGTALEPFDLRIEISDGVDSITGDRHALESLLVNLLLNAAKYSEGEQWVSVSARSVKASRGRRALAISVSNPVRSRLESDPERWFDPFERGRAALRQGIPGTGLGLAVAQAIAEQHAGGLSVQVTPHQQVRVTLFLPLQESDS